MRYVCHCGYTYTADRKAENCPTCIERMRRNEEVRARENALLERKVQDVWFDPDAPMSNNYNWAQGRSTGRPRRTHCRKGHAYAEHGRIRPDGRNQCVTCKTESNRAYKRVQRQK